MALLSLKFSRFTDDLHADFRKDMDSIRKMLNDIEEQADKEMHFLQDQSPVNLEIFNNCTKLLSNYLILTSQIKDLLGSFQIGNESNEVRTVPLNVNDITTANGSNSLPAENYSTVSPSPISQTLSAQRTFRTRENCNSAEASQSNMLTGGSVGIVEPPSGFSNYVTRESTPDGAYSQSTCSPFSYSSHGDEDYETKLTDALNTVSVQNSEENNERDLRKEIILYDGDQSKTDFARMTTVQRKSPLLNSDSTIVSYQANTEVKLKKPEELVSKSNDAGITDLTLKPTGDLNAESSISSESNYSFQYRPDLGNESTNDLKAKPFNLQSTSGLQEKTSNSSHGSPNSRSGTDISIKSTGEQDVKSYNALPLDGLDVEDNILSQTNQRFKSSVGVGIQSPDELEAGCLQPTVGRDVKPNNLNQTNLNPRYTADAGIQSTIELDAKSYNLQPNIGHEVKPNNSSITDQNSQSDVGLQSIEEVEVKSYSLQASVDHEVQCNSSHDQSFQSAVDVQTKTDELVVKYYNSQPSGDLEFEPYHHTSQSFQSADGLEMWLAETGSSISRVEPPPGFSEVEIVDFNVNSQVSQYAYKLCSLQITNQENLETFNNRLHSKTPYNMDGRIQPYAPYKSLSEQMPPRKTAVTAKGSETPITAIVPPSIEEQRTGAKSDNPFGFGLDMVAPIKMNFYLPVRLSYLHNSKEVFLHLKANVKEMHKLAVRLQDEVESMKRFNNCPSPGHFVVALFEGIWYRAKVIDVCKDRSCGVLFCDYGDCTAVRLDDLRNPGTSTIFEAPFFAIHLVLEHIVVTNPTKAFQLLQDRCENEDLRAIFHQNFQSSEIRHMVGILKGDRDEDLGKMLVSQGCADYGPTELPDVEQMGWTVTH